PAGMGLTGVRFNDLGQAMGVVDGHLMFYDGSSWTERHVLGLDGYTLASISDFNDRGEFVGLVESPAGGFSWGFVARPVPEPGSLLRAAVGLIPAAVLARRKSARPARRCPASTQARGVN